MKIMTQDVLQHVVKKMARYSLLGVALLAAQSSAQSFCFASAGSYYEQVYCELQARGEAKTLPPFYQFKRNDATTQALLLKRPAARIGIDLPMPKAAAKKMTAKAAPQQERKLPAPAVQKPQPGTSPSPAAKTPTSSACQLNGNAMRCGDQQFTLMGNRRNQRLAEGVLEAENKMALPVYHGSTSDQAAIDAYLIRAYRQYIEKMHEIGLGGVTMTYGKFYFLFFDLQEKGLDFSQRFETMYGFLKKDKATMGVSETLTPDSQLKAEDCDPLAGHMWVCSRAGRNYLYLAESE
ncbi:hypothetical protein ACSV5M_04610 [Cellvibrio sp. ARAG 10.3]|uniref:hypothetical protein n=1 Tax=Cellvibrio sp. ARAG 10.3 TaxID=3451358 RepID=UPI003F47D818